MRLCACQLRPTSGDIAANLQRHLTFVEVARSLDADLALFPECALTGYEPTRADQLALAVDDPRLAAIADAAERFAMTICVGLPTPGGERPRISLQVWQPDAPAVTYSKQLLHADERPWFEAGTEPLMLRWQEVRLAPAICYESLQPSHAAASAAAGAHVYLASVAKPARGMRRAHAHYATVARRHSMTVLMANSIGACDDFVAAGGSAAWRPDGSLAARLDEEHEGVLVLDTASGEAVVLSGGEFNALLTPAV